MRRLIIKRYFKIVLLIASLSVFKKLNAQYSEFNSSSIYSKLQGLNVLGSVLYIGATPADKNISLLTYFSKEKHYRTGFLSITRGEDLQNKYGYEQGIELGLIHVAEGNVENKIDDIENFYTRAYDVSPLTDEQEVFHDWDTGKILSDVVWIIRIFQPDVIITKYSPDEKTLNGEGKVSALIAEQAFKLAADSAAFPNQLKYGTTCWQVKRLLWNNNTNSEIQYQINSNTFSTVTGLSIDDITAFSKQYQKSIFSDDDTTAINYTNSFYLIEKDSAVKNIMDGVVTNWHRINDTAFATIQPLIDSVIKNYDFLQPQLSVKKLIEIYQLLFHLEINNNWKDEKLNDIRKLIFLCCGIQIKVFSNQEYAVTGDTLQVNFSISKKTSYNVILKDFGVSQFDSAINLSLVPLKTFSFSKTININLERTATQPYWLRNSRTEPYMYNVDDQYLIGKSSDDAEYSATIILSIDSTDFWLNVPVRYMPNFDELLAKNVSTVLPVIVSLSPNNILTNVKPGNDFTKNSGVTLKFKTNFSQDSIGIKIKISQLDFKVIPSTKTIGLSNTAVVYEKDSVINAHAGQVYSINVPVRTLLLPKNYSGSLGSSVSVVRNGITNSYSSFLKTIDYNYLPCISYYYRDITKIISDEIKTAGDSVGYIFSNGDWTLYALQQLGFTVKTLIQNDYLQDSLKKYTAIISGMNLKNIENYLGDSFDSLLNYVSNGGTLIFSDNQLKLNKSFKIFSVPQKLNVENNEAQINRSNTSLFNYPNTITTADFVKWKNSFTDYAFYGFDSGFQMPLAFNNTQTNKNVSNSLLIKDYGKGKFVFMGLSLPSQIASGEASAYKLLSNIIAISAANNKSVKK
jgi:hypothetical protein